MILKILSFILSVLFLSIGLLGCQQSGKEENLKNSTNVANSATQDMPTDMPSDFEFSIKFGVQKKNEINTFEGKVTKDLISDGTATIKLTLTEEEMEDIYEKMKEINIAETKEFEPEPVNGTVCTKEPYEEDEWEIILNGEMITQSLSGKYCEPTKDAIQLIELRNFVFNIIKSKDEYKALPDSQGAYL